MIRYGSQLYSDKSRSNEHDNIPSFECPVYRSNGGGLYRLFTMAKSGKTRTGQIGASVRCFNSIATIVSTD